MILDFFSRILIISRPLENLDSSLLPDDAYISLYISKNIASGKGPYYGEDYTNGFQPLYVFLIAPVYKLFPSSIETPVKVALVLLALFDCATLLILLLFVYKITRRKIITCFIGLAWIVNDYVVQTSINGLETIMAAFFLLWATYQFYRLFMEAPAVKPGLRQILGLGIITGFACISRIDSGIFALVMGCLIFFKSIRTGNLVNNSLAFAAGVSLIFSSWIIYSYYYTGDWYPISGKAVRFQSLAGVDHTPNFSNWYLPMLKQGLFTIAGQNIVLISILTLSALYLLYKKRWTGISFGNFRPLVIFSTLLYFAYTLYIFTPWYFFRYLFPFTLVLLLILSEFLKRIFYTQSGATQKAFIAFISILWIGGQLAKGELLSYYFSRETNNGYMNMALHINKELPAGSIIGSSQTGALSYFASNLATINLDGVVNKKCFEKLKRREALSYIKEANIQYVVGWEDNYVFIKKHSANFRDSVDLQLLQQIENIRTWGRSWNIYKVKFDK